MSGTSVAAVDPDSFADPAAFRERIMTACRPVRLPGAARKWPLLAVDGPEGLVATLRQFDVGREAEIFVGTPQIDARYFYDSQLQGFNFVRENVPFGAGLERIWTTAGQGGETIYMGSLPSERYLPGIEQLTPLLFVPPTVSPRFWIGHPSRVACHYDTQDNIACAAAGRRRFTLYPPEAIAELYVGPIDHTLSGQPVSLAMESEPGDPRFPRFESIRDKALIVELEPGDALYIPKLWWHQVEALDDFNILVNFWWDVFASGADQPYAAMLLALITIGERPPAERAAWRSWFDHYVFRPEGHPLDFLPEERRGILGALGAGNYQRIRMIVMRMLRGG